MIAAQNNRSIFIPILILAPGNELRKLPAGARINICIAVTGIFKFTIFASDTIFEVCIKRQHCEVERLVFGRKLFQPFLGLQKQAPVTISPRILFPLEPVPVNSIPEIIYFIVSVLGIIKLPSAEYSFTSYKKNIVISFRFENVTQCCNSGEEMLLRVHLIHGAVVVKHLRFESHLQRQSAALSEHSTHSKCCSGQYMTSIQLLRRARKILILLSKLCHFRYTVEVEAAPVRFIRKCCLKRLQKDINEISLRFWKSQCYSIRIHIILFYK